MDNVPHQQTALDYVPYEKYYVDFIDALVQVAKKNESKLSVQSDRDWDTINFIYKGWKVCFPISSEEFERHMVLHRALSNDKGIAKEAGGAMIQHMIEVPRPLYSMVQAIFPMQVWDKKFVAKFSEKLPSFKGSDAKL